MEEKGKRFQFGSEKLPQLIKVFEAFVLTAQTQQPRSLIVAPEGISAIIHVDYERRYHHLFISKSYFSDYQCSSPIRVIIEIQQLIQKLECLRTSNKHYVVIGDKADDNLFITDSKHAELSLTTVKNELSVSKDKYPTMKAYQRFDWLIIIESKKMHNILKQMKRSKVSEITLEFDPVAEKPYLKFSKQDGEFVSEPLSSDRILRNPFTTKNSESKVLFYPQGLGTTPVADLGLDSKTETKTDAKSNTYKYKSTFSLHTLSTAFKSFKLQHYVYLFLAPGQPLLVQYRLHQNEVNSQDVSALNHWITALSDLNETEKKDLMHKQHVPKPGRPKGSVKKRKLEESIQKEKEKEKEKEKSQT
jgi:hypothetical protein